MPRALAMAAVLLLAVVLRTTFVTGVIHNDNLAYISTAHDFAQHKAHDATNATPRLREGVGRLTTYLPVGLLYRIFGVSDRVTLAWPFLCSLLTVILTYRVTVLLAGESAGLIAALVWAILPLDVSLATTLLPDGPLAAFSTAAVWCLLLGERSSQRRAIAWYSACLACFVLAVLAKPTGLIVGLFLVVRVVSRQRLGWRTLVTAGAVVAIAAVLLVYYLRLNASLQSGHGQAWFHLDDLVAAATRWYRAMGESREFYALLPLFGVAACASLALARPGARVGFLWLATTFLYIELGTRSISAYRPLVDPLLRHVIFAIVPCAVLTGIYVGPALSTNVARWVVSVVALTLTAIVWLGGRHLPISLVGHSETVWPFAAASALAAAVTIFGSIASPLVVTSSSPVWRVTGVTTLLLAAGVSTLGPTFYAVRVYRLPWINNAREAAKFLVAHTDHPWLAQDEMLRGQLDYETAFTRSAALDVAPEEARKVGSAYIVVDDYLFRVKESLGATTAGYLRTPPPTWLQVARIGDTDEYRMRIYRALSAEDADRELSDAKRAHAASPTSETEKRVNDALVNAGNSCPLARQKWAAWRKRMPETSESELLGLIAACYAIDPSRADLNQVVYGNFAGGLGGWTHPETPGVRVETFPDVADSRYLKVTAESAAQRVVLLQSVQLAPNSVYAYEATLQSTVPIVALYISPDRARFDTQAAFYKWETRRLLFITPAWDGQPHNVDLIPFLLTAPGEIWLKNVKLNRLILE